MTGADPASKPFALTLGVIVLAFGGAIAGLFLVDYVGRPTLALTTFVTIFVIDLLVGILGFYASTSVVAQKARSRLVPMFWILLRSGVCLNRGFQKPSIC